MNGCADKKCPCRLWTNCSYYVDITDKHNRLKRKKYLTSIQNYYDIVFKLSYNAPDITTNG